MSQTGQNEAFKGYGGIEDPVKYINAEYGPGWSLSKSSSVYGLEDFTLDVLEAKANNCTLGAITRIMKHYSEKGYTLIPNNINEIYKTVRQIGVRHGYDPFETSLFRDLFVYTPWDIDNIVRDVWLAFGYPHVLSWNAYFDKLACLIRNTDNQLPSLLNITFGDYPGHTVTVFGYRLFSKAHEFDKPFVEIYDGWSSSTRFIDWNRFGLTPANVTTINPPAIQPNLAVKTTISIV